jgi:hypothetical protein
MPPASNAEPLDKRTVALPPIVWLAAEDIAAQTGEKPSEVYRRIFVAGISAERDRLSLDLSYENKRLINIRLKAKADGARACLDVLANPDAPEEDRLEAIAILSQWLSD